MNLPSVRIHFVEVRYDGEGPDSLCRERVHFVPREGERIETSNRLYKVITVLWHLYGSSPQNVTVTLERL